MTRNALHIPLCLCLGLLMALAGVQGALACPDQPAAAVVACGHDAVIWLDAAGKPVKAACRHCPACTGAALQTSPAAPTWAPRRAEPLGFAARIPLLPARATEPVARGPPIAG